MEDYGYQLTVKFGSDEKMAPMVNVRAKTEREFNAQLEYLKENAGTIVFVAETVRATAVVDQSMGAAVPSQPHANYQPAQVSQPSPSGAPPAQAQPANGTPLCAHGPMTYRTGISKKNNKPWAAHFCPAEQGQPQCQPVFH